MKTVLHLLAGGGIGGIETLCRAYAPYSKHNNIFMVVWEPGVVSDEMKENGACVIELNAKKRKHIKNIMDIKHVINEKKVDCIIVHHASPILHVYMMVLKKVCPNTTTIAYCHGAAQIMYREGDRRGESYRKLVLKRSLKKADRVVAVSQYVKDSLISCFHIEGEKIIVNYNAVDLNRFTVPRNNVDLDMNPLRLICVGRLIEGKGIQTVVRAVALCNNTIDVSLTIVGDGPYRIELERLVSELGIKERVFFVGNQNDVSRYLAEADIFIHTPLLEEGFGITVLEAMASGCVCICSKSGALPELVQDGVTGFLVEKEDANAIYELGCQKQGRIDWVKIRERSIQRAKLFSIELFAERLDRIIVGT